MWTNVSPWQQVHAAGRMSETGFYNVAKRGADKVFRAQVRAHTRPLFG
jgi:hypothetical protein